MPVLQGYLQKRVLDAYEQEKLKGTSAGGHMRVKGNKMYLPGCVMAALQNLGLTVKVRILAGQ